MRAHAPGKTEDQIHNNELPSRRAVEDTAPVAKTAIVRAQSPERSTGDVHHLHRLQDVADLLTVGADILHECCAGLSRDVREVLDSPPAVLHSMADEVIPGFGGAHLQDGALRVLAEQSDSALDRMHDHARKAAVAHQKVAASPQNEKRQGVPGGQRQGLPKLLRRRGAHEKLRRAANLEGCVGLERLVQFDDRFCGAGLRRHRG